MLTSLRISSTLLIAAMGVAVVCPLCVAGVAVAGGQAISRTAPNDTATVRMHISGMTCGSCPATARLALRRVPGVYTATVTLDDSLGVVTFDPRRVTPAQIAAQLAKVTDYKATILQGQAKK